MKHLILVAALALASVTASAGELDNESSVTNQAAINGTVVVRVDSRTNKAAVLATNSVMTDEAQAKALAHEGSFQAVSAKNISGELDKDGGASSWYYYNGYNPYYYSNMYWYGNWYQPCYSYNYSYYNYYYYSNRWW